jgi:hypothetical protein
MTSSAYSSTLNSNVLTPDVFENEAFTPLFFWNGNDESGYRYAVKVAENTWSEHYQID